MSFTVALVQTNFMVGFIPGNLARIKGNYDIAETAKTDLVVFSEMAITGYPPEDLVLRKGFQQAAMDAVEQLAAYTRKGGPAMVVGGLWVENDKLYNALFLMENGKVVHRQYKHCLPNYGVFDEKRLFAEGPEPQPVAWRGTKLGLMICEDMWKPDASASLKKGGAEVLISINASPYEMGKSQARKQTAIARVKETGLPLLYLNLLGGQDELVFDGRSFVFSAQAELCARLRPFEEDIALVRLNKETGGLSASKGVIQPALSEEETIYRAMVLGLRDYVKKNSFAGVVLGLSGGIDSAITAAVAVDALGKDRVRALMMPSPFTSHESTEDATECARCLGIRLDTIPIEPAMQVMGTMLDHAFVEKINPVTQENIQPRLRAALLMAVSNNENLLLVTTGNKSEMSVGYATLYGDMCGGYNVLKDVYKTTVYKISAWRNRQGEVIPQRILTKAPSAELKLNQTDQDTLPPYELLDAILLRLVEQQYSVDEVVKDGFARETVERVASMLYGAEYKRRQAPPGVKITGMSFGRDRRYPITSGWRK